MKRMDEWIDSIIRECVANHAATENNHNFHWGEIEENVLPLEHTAALRDRSGLPGYVWTVTILSEDIRG
jgi:hypothetical protein